MERDFESYRRFRHLPRKGSSYRRLATTRISLGASIVGLGRAEDEAGAADFWNTNTIVTEISGALISRLVLG
jgi:hypothetical protein